MAAFVLVTTILSLNLLQRLRTSSAARGIRQERVQFVRAKAALAALAYQFGNSGDAIAIDRIARRVNYVEQVSALWAWLCGTSEHPIQKARARRRDCSPA